MTEDVKRLTRDALLRELQVHQLELETQNRELREAQALLEASRARYADLYDFAPVGYCTLDERGCVVEINLTGAAMLGQARERLVGRELPRALDAEAARALSDHLARCRSGSRHVESEIVMHPRRADLAVQVVSEPAGDDPPLWRTVLTDVTAQFRARAALRWLADAGARLGAARSEDEIVAMLPAIAVPFLASHATLDLAGDARPGDDAAAGLRAAVLRARRDNRAELASRTAMVLPVARFGEVIGVLALTLAGPRRYGETDLALGEELASRVAAALGQARAYREARDAAERALFERERAEEASRAKDVFLANVSHELRTPLTSILGWTAMLRRGGLGESQRAKALEIIERGAHAQVKLIGDLLDISRILNGKMHMRRVVVDLGRELAAAVDAMRPIADARGIALISALCDEALVEGDPDRIQQVVINLLQNALKFTPAGGEVRVTLEVVAGGVRFCVSDNGAGIEAEALPRIFESFRQAEEGSARAYGGLGLGLAIVRHLVERHGGEVNAWSEGRGRGASFTVTLPRYDGRRRSIHPSAAAEPERASSALLHGLHVLVIEDDLDARELFTTALLERGAAVTAAASAPEGFAALKALRPQVIVSDVGLPGEDGCALMRRVRALAPEFGGATPALAVTAYARADDRDRALRAGFTAWAPKPIEPGELAAVVARIAHPTASN